LPKRNSVAHYGLVIDDITMLVTRLLRWTSFEHVKRKGNAIAYAPERKAKILDDVQV